MHRTPVKALLTVAAFALFLVPVTAIAAAGFDDVADDNVFKADIEWLADAEVTKGCNPPTNTRFCPGNNVTREQMAAFMHRLATNKVVDAATAVEAGNAGTLDGKDSSAFVEHGDIVTGTDGHNWTGWGSSVPSLLENWMGFTAASSDGYVGIGLTAPASVDGVEYGLKSVEVCYEALSPGFIANTRVYGSMADLSVPNLAVDETDRTTEGCYTVTVNTVVPYGASIGVTLAGGATGIVNLYGVRSTWTPAAYLPVGLVSTDSSDDYNNG